MKGDEIDPINLVVDDKEINTGEYLRIEEEINRKWLEGVKR